MHIHRPSKGGAGEGNPCPSYEFPKLLFCVLKRWPRHCLYLTIVFAIYLIAFTASTSFISPFQLPYVIISRPCRMSEFTLTMGLYTVIFPSYLTCDWFLHFSHYDYCTFSTMSPATPRTTSNRLLAEKSSGTQKAMSL